MQYRDVQKILHAIYFETDFYIDPSKIVFVKREQISENEEKYHIQLESGHVIEVILSDNGIEVEVW